MTVESNCAIAIATLSDWLKRLAPVFKQWDSKPNRSHLVRAISPGFERVTGNYSQFWLVHCVVCSCCDWSDYLFWSCFLDSHFKAAPYFKIAEVNVAIKTFVLLIGETVHQLKSRRRHKIRNRWSRFQESNTGHSCPNHGIFIATLVAVLQREREEKKTC